TKGPAAQNDLASTGILHDVIQVRSSTLFQGALEALYAVDRNIFTKAAHQRLVDNGGATGGVEHVHSWAIGFAQHADIAFDLRLQAFANTITHMLKGLRIFYLLSRNLHAGTLSKTLCDLGCLLSANRWQLAGHTTCRSTGKGRPGSKDHALRGITWGNAHARSLRSLRLNICVSYLSSI